MMSSRKTSQGVPGSECPVPREVQAVWTTILWDGKCCACVFGEGELEQ